MDSQQATVVGNDSTADNADNAAELQVIAHVKSEGTASNSSEKNANNHEKTIQQKFFKEIASHMLNATHVHITGTGQAQEQFIKFLAETPQFKNIQSTESTSNQLSDEKLLEMMGEKL